MIGHASAGPLGACVKVTDCCDPFSTGILTYVKPLELCVESTFATVSERFAITVRLFLFW
jgi:hypothetical protein